LGRGRGRGVFGRGGVLDRDVFLIGGGSRIARIACRRRGVLGLAGVVGRGARSCRFGCGRDEGAAVGGSAGLTAG